MKRFLLLLFALSLFCAGSAHAAGALITSVSAGSDGGTPNTVTSGSVDTTGADLIVAACSYNGGGSAPTFSDSKSNTWTAGDTQDNSCTWTCTRAAVKVYYVHSPTVGSGHTFTCEAANVSVAMLAFSGAAAAGYDQHTTAGDDSPVTALNAGSITPTEDNEIVVSVLGVARSEGDSDTYAIGGSYTLQASTLSDASTRAIAIAYWIQTTATATNPAWSWATGNAAAAVVASFKTTAATSSAVPRRPMVY